MSTKAPFTALGALLMDRSGRRAEGHYCWYAMNCIVTVFVDRKLPKINSPEFSISFSDINIWTPSRISYVRNVILS
jgi:hypothetical protein